MKTNRTCFQCGQQGHTQPECHLKERSQEGRDAFRQYQNACRTAKKTKKKKSETHHFLKFLLWLKTSGDTKSVCDPLLLASKHVLMHDGRPFRFELTKMLDLSYKEMFMDIIERTRLRFSGQTTRKDHDHLWVRKLNQAVKEGEPADFSQNEANRVYADNKLVFRTRYLYYLLMDGNSFSEKLRAKLLPISDRERALPNVVHDICVASVGGGPGYDHLAVCLVAWFLFTAQASDRNGLRPRVVRTRILDLFDQEWGPIAAELNTAFQQEGEKSCYQEGEKGREEVGWWGSNDMTMQYGDVREEGGLGSILEDTRLFICQFVLHENSSFLVDPTTGLLRGMVASVLAGAAEGSFLVCTDSGNMLWPVLKKTAALHGWECWSDKDNSEVDHKMMLFGPKAFVILERVCEM